MTDLGRVYIGKILIAAGAVLILAGLAAIFFKVFPVGRLPGDIHLKKGGFSLYVPITTSLIISIFLTLIFYLIGKK